MSILTDHGMTLKASKPNDDGLCTFKLIDAEGATFAELDEPCTLEEALAAARRLLEQEEQE